MTTPCSHQFWTFKAGLSVCLGCGMKAADGRGLPRNHWAINGEAMDTRRVENHFNCPECGQQIRLEWGNGPDRLVCLGGHDVSDLGYAVPRRKAEAALWRRNQLKEAGVNIFKTKLFPYVAGDSLVGHNVPVTIRGFSAEMITGEHGQEEGYILYFEGSDKGLILNKTNAKVLAKAFGPETDGWVGQEVILYSEHIKAFGKMHNAARVKIPGNGKPAKMETNVSEPPPPPPDEDYEKESAEADLDADQRQMDLEKYGL